MQNNTFIANPENKCNFCGWIAKNSSALGVHKASHTKDFCKTCKIYFGDKAKFVQHMKKHDEVVYKCLECSDVFAREETFNKHKATVHNGKESQYQCDICGWKYREFWRLSVHKRIHEQEEYFCRICKKYMSDKVRYVCHMAAHNETICRCYLCPEILPNSETLKIHIEAHPVIMQVCHICCKMYPKAALKTHNMRFAIQSYKCNGCGGNLSLQNSAPADVQKKFKCDPCNKVFIVKPVFLKQVRVAMKPFKCKICEARFSNGDLLKKHITTHKIHKEIICSICHDVLTNEFKFYLHKKSHQNETVNNNVCVKNEMVEEIKCEETVITNLEEPLEAIQQIEETNATNNNSAEKSNEHTESSVEISFLKSTLKTYKNNSKQDKYKEYVCENCGKKFGNNNLLGIHSKICKKLQNKQVFVCQNCSM